MADFAADFVSVPVPFPVTIDPFDYQAVFAPIVAVQDTSAPLVGNFAPVAGTIIPADQTISFDVTDETELTVVAVFAYFPDTTQTEVIWDGAAFAPLYAGHSTRTAYTTGSSAGFHYHVSRGLWPSKPRIRVLAVDRGGHCPLIEAAYELPAPAPVIDTGTGVGSKSGAALRTFRDAIREISPWWLRGQIGGSILYAIGSVVDLIADGLRAGVKMRFPGYYSNESLPLIGRERRIRRGRVESEETYARRLIPWLDHHRTRGGPYAMLAQIHAFYAPGNFPVELRYASGRRYVVEPSDGSVARGDVVWTPPDAPASHWARWWLTYTLPSLTGDGIWSDPGTWDDGGVWDLGLSPEEIADYRAIPREWNAAHANGWITLDSSAAGGLTITIKV